MKHNDSVATICGKEGIALWRITCAAQDGRRTSERLCAQNARSCMGRADSAERFTGALRRRIEGKDKTAEYHRYACTLVLRHSIGFDTDRGNGPKAELRYARKKEKVMKGRWGGSLLAWHSEGRHALMGEISALDTILSLRILLRLHRVVTEMLVTGVLFRRARNADP